MRKNEENKLYNFQLIDESGEISIKQFDNDSTFYDILELNQVR